MADRFSKDQILTVPNLLSLVRIGIIPLIVSSYGDGEPVRASVLVVLSGFTDLADGYIARKYHCVSDVGKILDPVADKLTISALILCLTARYEKLTWLLILFVGKELFMAVVGLIVMHSRDQVNSAQWFGKVTTFAMYAVGLALFLFPGVPEWATNGMIAVCGCLILLSLYKYMAFYRRVLKGDQK